MVEQQAPAGQIFIPQQALAEIGKLHMQLEVAREQVRSAQEALRNTFKENLKITAERDAIRAHFDKLVLVCTEAGIEYDTEGDAPPKSNVTAMRPPSNDEIHSDVSAAIDADAATNTPA